MGRIVTLLLLLLTSTGICFAEQLLYEKLFSFKQGELQESETWSGKILLLGDVLVPKEVTLTITPDSWIIYNETDWKNIGDNPEKPEIIVKGKLTIPDKSEIKMYALGDENVQHYMQEHADIEAVTIRPKPEPLRDLKEGLHTSKRAYSWLWVAVYSIWLVF